MRPTMTSFSPRTGTRAHAVGQVFGRSDGPSYLGTYTVIPTGKMLEVVPGDEGDALATMAALWKETGKLDGDGYFSLPTPTKQRASRAYAAMLPTARALAKAHRDDIKNAVGGYMLPVVPAWLASPGAMQVELGRLGLRDAGIEAFLVAWVKDYAKMREHWATHEVNGELRRQRATNPWAAWL